MKKILLIIGGESTALEIRELVDRYYKNDFDEVFNVIGNNEDDCYYSFIKDKNISDSENLKDKKLYYIVSFTNFRLKEVFVEKMESINAIPFNVIHPNAEVSPSAKLGKNIYIASNAIISSFSKIGDNVIINYNSIVGHDAIIGNNVVLNPSAKIGGNSKIGSNVLIGAGSFILQGIEIGDDTLIDAMTYIDRNIDTKKICTSKNLKVLKRVI